jgi:hypothetical protein
MLRCIICRPTPCQEVGNILNQSSVFQKGLIKYNKANGSTFMKTHIYVTHACLVVKRKLKPSVIVATRQVDINHNWQLKEKRVALSRSAITTFFGLTNLYKDGDAAQQCFWNIWSFTFVKDMRLHHHAKTFSYID